MSTTLMSVVNRASTSIAAGILNRFTYFAFPNISKVVNGKHKTKSHTSYACRTEKLKYGCDEIFRPVVKQIPEQVVRYVVYDTLKASLVILMNLFYYYLTSPVVKNMVEGSGKSSNHQLHILSVAWGVAGVVGSVSTRSIDNLIKNERDRKLEIQIPRNFASQISGIWTFYFFDKLVGAHVARLANEYVPETSDSKRRAILNKAITNMVISRLK